MDRNVPLTLLHQPQPGDWDPYRPMSNALMAITDRESVLLFDAFVEHWGWSLIPYCFPEEIQQRLQYALDYNPRINSVGSRVTFSRYQCHFFESFNDVNFYALSQLAKDPGIPIWKIWNDWAEKRFGKAAAPRVIAALKRTMKIGDLTYYFRGMWVQNHSRITDLHYLENKVLNTGRSMIEWGSTKHHL